MGGYRGWENGKVSVFESIEAKCAFTVISKEFVVKLKENNTFFHNDNIIRAVEYCP